MDTYLSKNVSNARIDAKGNVTIGDTIIFNARNVQDYIDLNKSLEEIIKQIENTNDFIKSYPQDNRFQETLKKLLADKQSIDIKISQTENEILTFANEIYRVPHSKEVHREVLELLKIGDLSKAKNKLSISTDKSIVNKLISNKNKIEDIILKINKDAQEKAYECFLFAKIIILEKNLNWYSQACRLFEDAIKLDERYEYVMDYAVFLQQHNDLIKSEQYYNQWENLIDKADPNYSYKFATYLNSLGNKYTRQNNLIKAKEIIERCLSIKNAFNGQINKQFRKASLAVSLNNYSQILTRLGKFKDAGIYAKCAYKIRKTLYYVDSDEHKSFYISSLLCYGSYLASCEDYHNAKKLFEEASNLLGNNFNSLTEDELEDSALSYNNLGCTLADDGQYDDSLHYLNICLTVREQLASKNPQKFNQEVARTFMNIGTVFKEQGKYGNAEEYFLKSLNILNSSNETNKNAIFHYLSATIANLILLYTEQSFELKKIEKIFDEAHKLWLLNNYSDQHLKIAIGNGLIFLKHDNYSYEQYLVKFMEEFAEVGKKYFVNNVIS